MSKTKRPGDVDHHQALKISWSAVPIVAFSFESECPLRELPALTALFLECHESSDPRVLRTGLQIIWQRLKEYLEATR